MKWSAPLRSPGKAGMWLFDRLVQWRTNTRIHTLEQQLAAKPTPVLYLQLADAHTDAGNQSKAAQVLRLGAARHPNAPEIVRRQAEAEKFERELEKKRLVERIQTHPNPILYARLAELYKADGETGKTIDICQRGIKAFPKYGGTYLVLGQIYSDKKQWPEAVTHLEKSAALDKYNYLALKLLSAVYLELGRPADAAQRLEDILFFAPGDEVIMGLLKKAKDAIEEQMPKSSLSVPDVAANRYQAGRTVPRTGRSGTPNVARASGINRISGLHNSTGAMPRPAKDQIYANGLAALRAVAGVEGAVLVDQYGLVVAADLAPGIDEGLAGAMITNVYRLASNNAVKLGVGQFEEGMIEGRDGNVHIVQFDDMILTVFTKADVKLGLVEKSIRDFAAVAIQRK